MMKKVNVNLNVKELDRGVIAMVELPEGQGSVQGGLRPCVIVSNSASCKYSPVVICVPLSSNINKKKLPTHAIIKPNPSDNKLKRASVALCEQIMTITKDSIRFVTGKLSSEETARINECMKISLSL